MTKFESGSLDHAGFLAIKENLVTELAAIIKLQLNSIGEDVKGISWFSSVAEEYALAGQRMAA